MPVNAEEAVAAVAATYSDPTMRHTASQVAGTDLWSVGTFEASSGMPVAGAAVLVGPDARVWIFSSNPGIHDWELVVAVLDALYREDLTTAVEQEPLGAAIKAATEVRAAQPRQIVASAFAGELKASPTRTLP